MDFFFSQPQRHKLLLLNLLKKEIAFLRVLWEEQHDFKI